VGAGVSDPAAVRATLAQALQIVLPGRVQQFPPTTRRYASPTIFIEQVSITQADDLVVGTFPVWVVVDGTVEAQVAMADDLVWNAFLALWPLVDAIAAEPQSLAGLRATVLACAVSLEAVTMCGLPAATAATIPPVTLSG